ncbi:MAG: hypothetical protein OXF24_08045 [Hyphomicrobiales bacterium]|nr:hypothetical protein [Hyphomicrobiales bacterium]MCY4049523.1 hypothetical protein [Hyphomicrobiales bacterium]MCY4052494.1 hypothetical protein [Hyphomicrobiales bacterium]
MEVKESIQITIANVTIDYDEPAKKDIERTENIIKKRSKKLIERIEETTGGKVVNITHFGNNGDVLSIPNWRQQRRLTKRID